jgi:murein DD-endopeptidase MepM/ murein hydrolase activator NlpD
VDGRVTSGIGWRPDPFGSGRTVYHHGVDISVPVGTPVHPTQQGYVFFAGQLKNYGYAVAIAHGEGYVSFYGHNSQVCVQPGQWVDTASVIALSGNTGRSTGPHVHYEVRRTTGLQKEQQEQFIRETMERIAAEVADEPGGEEG